MAVARCTVERLMRRRGLRGVIRGKVLRTTISNAATPFPADKVNRQFKAERPNQLWVSDFSGSDTACESMYRRRNRGMWAYVTPTSQHLRASLE